MTGTPGKQQGTIYTRNTLEYFVPRIEMSGEKSQKSDTIFLVW